MEKSKEDISELIRREIRYLDSLTDEKASLLPIKLERLGNAFGAFHSGAHGEYFIFDLDFFASERVSDDQRRQVIRHEYIHYLNNRVYHQKSHGFWFNYCQQLLEALESDGTKN